MAAHDADYPVVTIPHLGPYEPTDVSDFMLTMAAQRDGPPIILKQEAPTYGGGMRTAYAVLATKDVRLACADCFRRDMRITDSTRVKTCASFVKHWSTKQGARVCGCKEDGDVNFINADITQVVVDTDGAPKSKDITEAADEELLEEMERRGLVPEFTKEHAMGLSQEDLAYVFKARGIRPLIDARPYALIHELKRQSNNTLTEDYYADEKKEGKSHFSEPCGATLVIPDTCVTRSKRKREVVVARYETKAFDGLG